MALTLGNAVHEGNRIKFDFTSADLPGAEGPTTVYVALAENKVQSNVGGGENGGRSLSRNGFSVSGVRDLAQDWLQDPGTL